MAAAQKVVAAFLGCLFVLSAMQGGVQVAEAAGSPVYRECFDTCLNDCMKGGRGYTDCEMKCDTECGAKEFNAKLKAEPGN
ncbi:hypothetical protein DM860_012630 [Cuscuta australis]|uniref:Uncharacterized protein n=1 Tax=Cuscuta australis TaxID=267555 RepID=A0A328DGV1_9ASTE|nr:hypothetical protein DM860_012630 [Cuscuta australis]